MVAHTLDNFIKLPPDPTPFHVFPLLPKHGMLLVFAPTKYLKSFLALNLAYDLAEGRTFWSGYKVKSPKRVLVLEQECGQDELQSRVRKIHAWRAGGHAPDNLWLVSKDLDCALDSDKGLEIIQKHVEQAKPEIIVLDPLSWFHSKNGNDNDDMKWLMRRLLKWQQDNNLASIVTAHCGKPGEFRSGNGGDINSIKGASAIGEAASAVIGLSRPSSSKTIIQLNYTLRHAGDPPPTKLQFDGESGKDTNTFEVVGGVKP